MVTIEVDEFEKVAKFAAAETDTVRLEFIGGRIGVRKAADGDHGTVVMWLMRRCVQARPDLNLNPLQGLKVEKHGRGRARPDGSLVPTGHFAGQGEWADPDGVLMTLEVTSYEADTGRRDREEKPVAYAAAGIPVYLLIDRDTRVICVHSDPDPATGSYRRTRKTRFGERLVLPDPVGFELDTETLPGSSMVGPGAGV